MHATRSLRWMLPLTLAAAALALAGCSFGRGSGVLPPPEQPTQAFATIDKLAGQVEGVSDPAKRDELLATIERLRGQLTFGQMEMPPTARLLLAKDIQILPTTQVADWNGDGKFDGFEVLVEALDHFGDSTKIVGKIYFELFAFRAARADNRSLERIAYWEIVIDTPEESIRYWDRFARNYHFNLVWPKVPEPGQRYILQATYVAPWGETFETQRTLVRQEK